MDTPHAIEDARRIVTDPEMFDHPATIRSIAWAVLKAARGQTCRQTRMGGFRPIGAVAREIVHQYGNN